MRPIIVSFGISTRIVNTLLLVKKKLYKVEDLA